MSDFNANELVKVLLKIRDKKDKIRKETDKKVAELDEQLDIINQQLQDILKQTGATSIKTPHGTAYQTVKARYWTDNWDAMYNFIQNHEAHDLLERRIHQSNMKLFLEENPDLLPEGLNVDSKYSVTVRRK
tara:strand:- start:842 stop:1234 length:393 start_codon:yes stop_codon:yes gene_type:complete